jgi:hypothetical protein
MVVWCVVIGTMDYLLPIGRWLGGGLIDRNELRMIEAT